MPSPIIVPDSILDNPVFNDLNPASQPLVGGRIMSSGPHVDGLLFGAAEVLGKDSANLVLTRNAKGDWSLNRTSAGAETYNIRISIDQLLRLGETYVLGDFGTGQTYQPSAPPKGVAITDVFAIYSVTVATLTSATIRLGKTVYSPLSAGAAIVQTDILAATGIATAINAGGAASYGTQKVAVATPVFHTDDLGLLEIEAVIVMQNTGVLRFVGIGCHCNFNYD